MIFDNRDTPPLPGFPPGLHFSFEIRRKRILYCYIRKNACSAFKHMIVVRSPHRAQLGKFPSRLKFLRHHHGARDIRAEEHDHTIFVWRDPVERLLSVWRNKFIQRDGNRDIFASYAATTGRDPAQASFAEFLEAYMAKPLPDLNVHVHPQHAALAPIRYSDALPLRDLHDHMVPIIGPKPAARFFRQATNATLAPAGDTPADARTRTADDLHRHWKETGAMPAASAFLAAGDADHIRALYAADTRMLAALQPADAIAPEEVTPA
jgi:hypothetical protein